jgi:hypothetical protein
MNEDTNQKVRSLSSNRAAVRMRQSRKNARFLLEIPDRFAVARWGCDADVATICRRIERSEKDGADDEAFWRQMERMPDLQALVERTGRRHAASIGEEYIEDPFRRAREAPHQGGYLHITPEEWARWDRANEVYQVRGARVLNGDDAEYQTGPHSGPHGPDRVYRLPPAMRYTALRMRCAGGAPRFVAQDRSRSTEISWG